jgi:16S rRNA (cytosine967-C5)-methyltransferase
VTGRERAYQALRRIAREDAYAWLVLEADASRYGESNFVRVAVLGVLRWRARLDHAIEKLADRRIERLQEEVRTLLRVGIHELMFMSSPGYAVVAETVSLAAAHAPRARGLVNAVLRKASSIDLPSLVPDGDSLEAVAVRLSHPLWLLKRWEILFGRQRAAEIAEANQGLSYPDLLLNPASAGARAALSAVDHEPSTLVADMVRLKGSTSIVGEWIARGEMYPMDEGSAVIAAVAGAAGTEVLDLAAAPGGKTLYLGSHGARVTSLDISASRLQTLRRQWPLFLQSAPRIVVGDGRRAPFRRPFQTVLLDAPCSATGTLRKNPEIKWRLKEAQLADFAILQRELLAAALHVAAESVVYSTCSLEPEENDAVVDAVLASSSAFQKCDIRPLVPPGATRWVTDGVLRLTPESGADGFTALLLRRHTLSS